MIFLFLKIAVVSQAIYLQRRIESMNILVYATPRKKKNFRKVEDVFLVSYTFFLSKYVITVSYTILF